MGTTKHCSIISSWGLYYFSFYIFPWFKPSTRNRHLVSNLEKTLIAITLGKEAVRAGERQETNSQREAGALGPNQHSAEASAAMPTAAARCQGVTTTERPRGLPAPPEPTARADVQPGPFPADRSRSQRLGARGRENTGKAATMTTQSGEEQGQRPGWPGAEVKHRDPQGVFQCPSWVAAGEITRFAEGFQDGE